MKRQYPDLGSAPSCLNQISHAARPIRSITQIWVVTHHQHGISAHVTLTHLTGKAGVVASPNFGCFLIGWKYLFLTQQCYNSFHFILTDLLSFASCIRTSFVLGAVLKRVFDSMGDCTHRLTDPFKHFSVINDNLLPLRLDWFVQFFVLCSGVFRLRPGGFKARVLASMGDYTHRLKIFLFYIAMLSIKG